MNSEIAAFDRYLVETKKVSVNTETSYLRDLQYFGNYITKRGFKSLYGVDQTVLQAYLYKFTRSGKSASTAARNMASLKCFYNFAVISGKLLQNPVKGTQRFHRRKKSFRKL